jgi:hypothetical protein
VLSTPFNYAWLFDIAPVWEVKYYDRGFFKLKDLILQNKGLKLFIKNPPETDPPCFFIVNRKTDYWPPHAIQAPALVYFHQSSNSVTDAPIDETQIYVKIRAK